MLASLHLLGTFVANVFKSRHRLEVENVFLRHQLNIALRRGPQRARLRGSDRVLLVWMTRLWPSLFFTKVGGVNWAPRGYSMGQMGQRARHG